MYVKYWFIILMIILTFFNCSKDSTSPDDNENENGANTITMEINGVPWTNSVIGGAAILDSTRATKFGIVGTNGEQIFSLYIQNSLGILTGRYTNQSGLLGAFFDSTSGISAATLNGKTSEIWLNTFDLNNSVASGTFDLYLVDFNNSSDTLRITNGKFINVPIDENGLKNK